MPLFPIIRKTTKWVGAAATVVLIATWVGSVWWKLSWGNSSWDQICIARGELTFMNDPDARAGDRFVSQMIVDNLVSLKKWEEHRWFESRSEDDAEVLMFKKLIAEQEQELADIQLPTCRLRPIRPGSQFKRTPPPNQKIGSSGYWILNIPLWLVAAPALALTAAARRVDYLARHRTRIGYCPKCNYNRQGLPALAICPECGAEPTASATANPGIV